jgi:hypothetical protein
MGDQGDKAAAKPKPKSVVVLNPSDSLDFTSACNTTQMHAFNMCYTTVLLCHSRI